VLRIHDTLVQIRIRVSMTLTNGSGFGSGSCFFVTDLQDANNKLTEEKKNCCLSLFEGTLHLHHFAMIKSQKELTKQ
jgi:hypothetical protein